MNTLKNYIEKYYVKNNYLNTLVITFLFLSIIFTRSFLGIQIWMFRLGELVMAFSALIFLITLIIFKPIYEEKYKSIFLTSVLVLLTFGMTVVFTGSNLFNVYTYKASSYIWSIGFLFLGLTLPKLKTLRRPYSILLQISLLIIYLVAIYDFPENIVEFFYSYSDKYEPHKGSDIVINFAILIYFLNRFYKHNQYGFELFLVNLSIFLPLFLYKSRAALISILIFVIYELFLYRKEILRFNFRRIIVFLFVSILLIVSTFLSQRYVVVEFSEETIEQIPDAFKTLGEYKFSKYKDDYPLFYISEKRLFSGDGNLNWRLQLWQDAIEDNYQENKLFYGIGYKSKFNVFIENNLVNTIGVADGNDRRGLDGLNEHVHNYFLTIFLRGGFLQLLVFFTFYYSLFQSAKKNNQLFEMIIFSTSVMFVSFFDSSMENAHFPLLFYFFVGNQYLKKS